MQRPIGMSAVASPVSASSPPSIVASAALLTNAAPPPPHRHHLPGGAGRQAGTAGATFRSGLSASSPTRVAPLGEESCFQQQQLTMASLSPPAEPRPQPPLLSKLLPGAFPPLTPAEDKVVASATHVFLSESMPVQGGGGGRRGSQQTLPPKSPKSPRSPRPPKGAANPAAPYQPSVTSPLASPQHQQQQHQLLGPPASPTSGLQHLMQQQQHQYQQQQHTYAVPYAGQLQQQQLLQQQQNLQQQQQLQQQQNLQQQQQLGSRTRSHPNLLNDYVNVVDASPDKPPLPHQNQSGHGPPLPLHPHHHHHHHHQQQQHQQSQDAAVHNLRLQLEAAQSRAGRVDLLERELSRLADAHEALVRSAERSARLETAVRRRLERECALLRQENAQLRERLLCCTSEMQHHQQTAAVTNASALAGCQEALLRLEAENLALKEQLRTSSLPQHQQQQQPHSTVSRQS